MQNALIKAFQTVGQPLAIKVDNGRPLGDPKREIISVMALWLISLGIRVILNKPRTPTDNAVVERSQGVLANWVEYHKCKNTADLQSHLTREADCYNHRYKVTRLKNRTRIEAFPGLLKSPHPFNSKGLDVQKAIDFVAKGAWERDVSKNGQLSFWGQRIGIGKDYAHHRVNLKLNAKTNQWEIFAKDGKLIKAYDSNITRQNLERLDMS